jgi:serine/threonine protein kinase
LESQFIKTLMASGLVPQEQLDYCLRLLRHRQATAMAKNEAIDLDRVLREILIEQGAVTEYQAFQLVDGKIKFRLGPYVITDFIGQGGMGQVFKAVHQIMGRECAVKVLPLHRVNEETIAGFMREIRLQARLDCPHLVRAYDAGQDGSVHYLVTEYVPGMDLRKLVKTRGRLRQDQASSIIMQAALGLNYAHEQGMVHRDVKPGNILVTPDSIAKVSDVGLAGFTRNLSDDPRAGKIVGTPDFLSPEQYKTPLNVGPVSDVYSLGCTLYYSVTGKAPFPGGDIPSKIRRHLEATPLHPRNFNPDLSDEFVDVIAEMMEKDPRKRIQDCAEVAARLEVWATNALPVAQSNWTRGPWMAPPPVMPEFGLPTNPPDEVLYETSMNSLETHPSRGEFESHSVGENSLPGSRSNAPPPPQFLNNEANPVGTMSRTMLVAMTIAVVLPPALLIGAILGYLIAYRS